MYDHLSLATMIQNTIFFSQSFTAGTSRKRPPSESDLNLDHDLVLSWKTQTLAPVSAG